MFTAAKRVSQVVTHMSIAFALASIISGSALLGGLAIIVEPIINVVLLPFHEKAWASKIYGSATGRARYLLLAGEKLSQTMLHAFVAFSVMWAVTGSKALGGIAALIEPICNVIVLPFHDRLWNATRKRLQRGPGSDVAPAVTA
ncbi:MAG: DUF2061 domain-containing protein [Pseudomonadota bacterium]|nr:DUF2061 domain-containing protein [Pseudomonadota bacterium]